VLPDSVLLVDAGREGEEALADIGILLLLAVDGDAHEKGGAWKVWGQCSRKGAREATEGELGLECYWMCIDDGYN